MEDRDVLYRARPGIELRANDDGTKTLYGHFARFNEVTEIHSWFEGDFREQVAPGAFRKTIKENRSSIKVLFDHGHDPELGNKPLGPIDILREDDEGGYYEVPLIDASYNRDFVIPASEAGLLGASFRFSVIKDEWDQEPDDGGLPMRTLKEVRLYEFGPVTFPAYEGATAGVRALTDHYIERLLADPKVRDRLTIRTSDPEAGAATSVDEAATTTTEPQPDGTPGLTAADRDTALRSLILQGVTS